MREKPEDAKGIEACFTLCASCVASRSKSKGFASQKTMQRNVHLFRNVTHDVCSVKRASDVHFQL